MFKIRLIKNQLVTLVVIFMLLSNSMGAQCPNTNLIWLDLTPTGAGNTQTSTCTYAGDYNTFTACLGAEYTITTCGSSQDTRITMYEDASGILITTSDADNCTSNNESIVWTSTLNGVVRVLVDRWNCGHNSICGSCSVTMNTSCGGGGGGGPGDDCSNPTVIACGGSLTSETTIGNTNTESGWSCLGFVGTTPGEDHFYSVQWPDAAAGGTIRLTFSNVTDANDTYMEVLSLGSSCAPNTCINHNQMDIFFGLFGSGQVYIEYTVPAGITDYYFVVDSQNDGIDSYDIMVECFATGIELDNVNNCPPFPITAPLNQGYYQTWDGAEPDATVTPAELAAMAGNTYTVCENVYIQNPLGWEWLKYFDVTLGECWTNPTNLTPNGNNTAFYATTAPRTGDWAGTNLGGTPIVLNWTFTHDWNPTWGDGDVCCYSCNLYSFCFDAEVDPLCNVTNGFQNQISATDDGIGSGGGGTVNPSNVSLSSTSATVLPIELISFSASPEIESGKNIVVLNWVTASETNNDFYTVERSLDGIHFEVVTNIPGAGTSSDINNYYAVDQHPYSGVSYYRLKQTDFNDHSEHFDIVPVQILSTLSNVSVFPNPTKEELTISFSSIEKRKEYVLTIYSVVGQIVHKQLFFSEQGFNQVKFNTSGLPIGMYFLAVGSGDEHQKLKFTKE
jgi:hypothetical protein